MKEHLIVLAAADRALLGELRTLPQLFAADQGDQIWLRGIAVAQANEAVFLSLPATARYFLGEDHLIFSPGGVTPVAYLPKLSWQPIATYIVPEMPVAAYGGVVEDAFQVKLVVSDAPQAVVALRCDLAQLQAWADSAAEIRIHAMRFAVADDGRALVVGDPLPTIPGEAFWECGGLLLPAGRKLEFAVLASAIRQQLDPDGAHLLLFQADGGFERIPQTNMIQATRSGIRQTTLPTQSP
jgi:MoxR-vWA-beta-propeller ternary system domain bpX2